MRSVSFISRMAGTNCTSSKKLNCDNEGLAHEANSCTELRSTTRWTKKKGVQDAETRLR